jgi:peptide deformylase
MQFTYKVPEIITTTAPKPKIPPLVLVEETDKILHEPVPVFDFKNSPVDPIEFTHAMIRKMIEHRALGLAANQVGYPYRMFVMSGEPNYACFNPVIVGHGLEEDRSLEGCLSYPELYIKVKRHSSIKVRFTMPNGEATTKTFAGLTARVFQHELDHLDGKVFYQSANPVHKEKAFKDRRIRFKRKS